MNAIGLTRIADAVIVSASLLLNNPQPLFQAETAATIQPMNHCTDAESYPQGLSLSFQGRHEEAIVAFSALVNGFPNCAEAYVERGIAYLATEQFETAIADFSVALEYQPDTARAWFYRLRAFQDLGQTDKAEADLDQLLSLTPVDIEIAYFQGQASQTLYDDDYTDYGHYVELTPETAQDYYYRAHFYVELGNHEAALADYSEAINRSPEFVQAYYDRAVLQWIERCELDAALADFAQVLAINPRSIYAYINRAHIFTAQGNLASAAAADEAAMAINPELAAQHTNSSASALLIDICSNR